MENEEVAHTRASWNRWKSGVLRAWPQFLRPGMNQQDSQKDKAGTEQPAEPLRHAALTLEAFCRFNQSPFEQHEWSPVDAAKHGLSESPSGQRSVHELDPR